MKIFVLLFLITMPAYATDMHGVDREAQAGQATEYMEGHEDGCESGRSDAGDDPYEYTFTKDVRRYETDEVYRQGWDRGFEECRMPK